MHSRCNSGRGELGSVTAELAVALPAFFIVMGIAISGVFAAAQAVRLQDIAGDAARAVARGDAPEAFVHGASLQVSHAGALVCVTVTERVFAQTVSIEASSCADAAGR